MISRTFLIKQNGNFANFWWGDGGEMMRVTKAKINKSMNHQNLKYLAQKLLKLKKFLVFNDAIVQGRSSIQASEFRACL